MILKRFNERLKDRKEIYDLKKSQRLERFKKKQEKWYEGKRN